MEEAIKKEVTKQAKKHIRELALADMTIESDISHFYSIVTNAELVKSGIESIITFAKDCAEIAKASQNAMVKKIRAASNKLNLGDTWEPMITNVQVPDLDAQVTAIFARYPLLHTLSDVSRRSYYSHSNDDFKEHKKSILDYLAAM